VLKGGVQDGVRGDPSVKADYVWWIIGSTHCYKLEVGTNGRKKFDVKTKCTEQKYMNLKTHLIVTADYVMTCLTQGVFFNSRVSLSFPIPA
jgi:hypothetical protein